LKQEQFVTGPTLKPVVITGISAALGKINVLDYSWPDQIDHQGWELNDYCIVIYVNCHLTGKIWSICVAFAPDT